MTETQRVAIVTGAAGGIGRAMVQGLMSAGVRVAGVDRDREPTETLAANAREQGKAAGPLTIATDLTDDSAADAIAKATRAGLAASTSSSTTRASARDHVRSVAPLRRGAHDSTTRADERRRARNDAPGWGRTLAGLFVLAQARNLAGLRECMREVRPG
jgi:NAD(P)-dependent dehydrogenase (short-subunit alcohol dehydrogenase family)